MSKFVNINIAGSKTARRLFTFACARVRVQDTESGDLYYEHTVRNLAINMGRVVLDKNIDAYLHVYWYLRR